MAKFTQNKLKEDLREILRKLVNNVIEVKSRKDQPAFNQGLDIICDYDEAIEKILERTPKMYEACHHAEIVLSNLSVSQLGELTQQQELCLKELNKVLAEVEKET